MKKLIVATLLTVAIIAVSAGAVSADEFITTYNLNDPINPGGS